MPVKDLLDPASAPIECVACQADDVEGVHHRDRVGQLLGGGGLEASESVHRDHLDAVAPGLRTFGEPGLERLLGAALDHVQQPGRSGAGADPGQVDDHGDVLVASPGVAPDVLVDTDRGDTAETAGVVDQHPLALGQDRVVGGVPRHPETLGDPRDGEVLGHDPFQRPPQPTPRELRPWLGGPAGVLAPHVPAPAASVPTDGDQQRRGPPAQRFVCQPPDHRAARRALAPAAPAPDVGLEDPARQHRTAGLEPLAGHLQPELVEAGERGQVRAGEGSVRHVEVFQMSGVRTFIFGRPRRLPGDRRADHLYTLVCEEP